MNLALRSVAVATLTLALTLALTPLIGPHAQAETWTHVDAQEDVLSVSGTGEDEMTADAPENTSADVTRIQVRHRPARIVTTLTVRDLVPRDDLGVVGIIETPTDVFDLFAIRSRGRNQVVVFSSDWSGGRCRGRSLALSGDRIVVRLPRTCLDDPRWVRVGAVLVTGERGTISDDDGGTYFVDDALRERGARRVLDGSELKLGPKVRVG